jgi:ribosomal-protein-serine acetyltransferase
MFSATLRPGVELRLPEERFASEIFKVVDRERKQLSEWITWVHERTCEEDILAWIRAVLNQFAENKGFSAVIWVEGRIAGVIGILPIDWRDRKAEIGYWLAKEFEGRGLITDASRVVIRHLLIELDLHRVEIHCASGNTRSRAVARRLGFRHEGTLRERKLLNGHFVDLEVYGLLRQEWLKAEPPADPAQSAA